MLDLFKCPKCHQPMELAKGVVPGIALYCSDQVRFTCKNPKCSVCQRQLLYKINESGKPVPCGLLNTFFRY